MYLYSIPETTLIIYGIRIERECYISATADFKYNLLTYLLTYLLAYFRNGVWGGDLLLRYDFFLFCLNKQTNRISF
jgi:hypothetical protein